MNYIIAVMSDIHGNLEGLEAVLCDMRKYSPDKIICLGDVIGYGPDPCKCLDIMLSLENIILLKGNHEDIFLGNVSSDSCSSIGKLSAEWNAKNIPERYLLPVSEFLSEYEEENIGFFHTASKDKHSYPYLNSIGQILSGFETANTDINFYGHTHRPRATCVLDGKVSDHYVMDDESFEVFPGGRYYINVGSVGQQRDTRTDCSYALIRISGNSMNIDIKRLEYDSYKTYRKIREKIKRDEIAAYLIREDERRTEYERAYNGS